MHVSSAGKSLVEGHSCFLSVTSLVSMSLVSHVFIVPRFDVSRFAWFSVVVFMVVCMFSYGETWFCVLIRIVLFQRHSLSIVPFFVHPSVCGHFSWKDSCRERHTHHARRRKKHCQRRGMRRPVKHCRERQWSHLSAFDEQARREILQPFGHIQTDAHADAQIIACT